MVIQPDFAAPLQHLHNGHEEAWFVLDGEIEFTSGTRVTRVGPGGWVLVPIGVPHTFSNAGGVPARFIAVMTPNFYLGYFDELSRAMDGVSDEARGRISAGLMAKYQTEVVDPVAWERDHGGAPA
ncbi:cupin domain-containing protein [Nonomuraea sp. M3C6]|uniref:Cupin domain-containing protein n=1 Tax=Nonomuraea marmarensis TaxID=3351344 RepID=A0ABW7AR83_9ACTN